MVSLCKYNGLSRCIEMSWEKQQYCEYAEKSPRRHCCLWVRSDGTCSNPDIVYKDGEDE